MKNKVKILTGALVVTCSLLLFSFTSKTTETKAAFEYTSITVLESIIPNGLGRSRIIHAKENRDYKEFSKMMTADDKGRNKSKRGEIRVKTYEETKLLNFYNMGGIRMQNIAANDAVVNSKINGMLNEGWEIINISTGVESYSGKEDQNGIFITRFYFKRNK
jgi:hypothetical protein